MKLAVILSTVWLAASSTTPRVGESTAFVLNKQLSSRVITSGKVNATVSDFNEDSREFTLDLNCNFKFIGGGFGGTQQEKVPEDIFNGEWLSYLREQGTVELPSLKIKHQGYEDLTLLGGVRLSQADKIYLYDIKSEDEPEDGCFTRTLETMGVDIQSVTDLTIQGWVSDSLPVGGLGRVKIEGKQNGFAFKVTLDHSVVE